MNSPLPDRDYYRKLRRRADFFRIDLNAKHWCDMWHTHFDWHGFGNLGWVHRRRHLSILLKALCRARVELSHATHPYQLFAIVHPRNSTDDAIYVHTENPNHTEFPHTFQSTAPIDVLPPLLAGRINRSVYSVSIQRYGEETSYVIQPHA